MYRIIFSAALALVTTAVPAVAQEQSFTRDGVTYIYTVSTKSDARILNGTTSDGSTFHLVVHNGHVTGEVDDQRVFFEAPKVQAAEKVAHR